MSWGGGGMNWVGVESLGLDMWGGRKTRKFLHEAVLREGLCDGESPRDVRRIGLEFLGRQLEENLCRRQDRVNLWMEGIFMEFVE